MQKMNIYPAYNGPTFCIAQQRTIAVALFTMSVIACVSNRRKYSNYLFLFMYTNVK